MSDEPTWSALPVRAQAPPSASERAAAVARLAAWARARGAQFDGLELRVDAGGNATAHARAPIARGEPIVTIPRALILTDRELAASATGEPDPYGDGRRVPRDTLAVWLALEVERADSPWRAFLDVLPVQLPDLPVFRGGAALARLAGTAAQLLAAEQRRDIVETYASFTPAVRARVSLAAYAWGRAMVSSRGFNAPDTVEAVIAHVPVVDLMDHARGETTWRYELDRARYVVVAARDLAAGDEVHFDYGAYGNAHFLVEYGFALADNPDDEALVVVGGEPFLLTARPDERWTAAMEQGALAPAVARRLEALAAAIAPPTSAWEAMCANVRRGERRTLETIAALLASGVSPGP